MSASMPRGASLLMAMVVVVMMSLLVAGAITFTGSERSAAVLQSRNQEMSSCAQAARNLFLSHLRVARGNIGDINFASDVGGNTLSVGHLGPATLKAVHRLPDSFVGGDRSAARDISNRVGNPGLLGGFYRVTVLCAQGDNGPKREMEFVVRVGL